MYAVFHDVVNNVSTTINKYAAETGKPVIGVLPAYFPMELIEAVNGFPVQLWGNNLAIEKADTYLQSFCCSIARSILELEMRNLAPMVKAYVFTSLCDTLINLREIFRSLFDKPTIELSIPITQTDSARKSYLENVVRAVIHELETITGSKLTTESLVQARNLHAKTRELQCRLYDLRRRNPGLILNHDFYTVIKAGFFLPRQTYNKLLENLLDGIKPENCPHGSGPKILLSGMVFDPLELHRIMDELNIRVVDDDFANGWRTASKKELETANLIEGITDFLFYPTPCCCLYNPANDRHRYLVDKVKAANADGVLFWYMNFCEPDAFDRPQLVAHLKENGIPAAIIDVEMTLTNFDAVKTRITAFCEMLEG
jgi:bcr-type benzoyl-CoA reductase subunit C